MTPEQWHLFGDLSLDHPALTLVFYGGASSEYSLFNTFPNLQDGATRPLYTKVVWGYPTIKYIQAFFLVYELDRPLYSEVDRPLYTFSLGVAHHKIHFSIFTIEPNTKWLLHLYP